MVNRRFNAKVCSSPPFSTAGSCWRIPWHRQKKYLNKREAIINLEVTVLEQRATVPVVIPFLIDTGTHQTLIPKVLLEDIFLREPKYAVNVIGLMYGSGIGHPYRAVLSIPRRHRNDPMLSFGDLEILVVPFMNETEGCLGVDALRRITMLSLPSHIYFSELRR